MIKHSSVNLVSSHKKPEIDKDDSEMQESLETVQRKVKYTMEYEEEAARFRLLVQGWARENARVI